MSGRGVRRWGVTNERFFGCAQNDLGGAQNEMKGAQMDMGRAQMDMAGVGTGLESGKTWEGRVRAVSVEGVTFLSMGVLGERGRPARARATRRV